MFLFIFLIILPFSTPIVKPQISKNNPIEIWNLAPGIYLDTCLLYLVSCLFGPLLLFLRVAIHADLLVFLSHQQPPAFLADIPSRLIPKGEFALREAVAAVKDFARLARPALNQLAVAALWAFYARRLHDRLDVPAFGIAAASQKVAEAPVLHLHRTAALVAFLPRQLALQLFLLRGLFHHLRTIHRFGVLAFGIIGTGQKLAVPAQLHDHLAPAFFAYFRSNTTIC